MTISTPILILFFLVVHPKSLAFDIHNPKTAHQGYTKTGNRDAGFRTHFRDHLGTSSMSRGVRPMRQSDLEAPNNRDYPDMVLTINNAQNPKTFNLIELEPEFHLYAPFGERIDGDVASPSDPRYNDHKYDQSTGFNYMKGRFQLPEYGRFNRPDPMRDWDWTRPHSLNLYQYCKNDPVNGWEPDGLLSDLITDEIERMKEIAVVPDA